MPPSVFIALDNPWALHGNPNGIAPDLMVRCGCRAFGECHHHGIALVGRPAETLADVVLGFDLDAPGRGIVVRGHADAGQIVTEAGIRRKCNARTARLAWVKSLHETPPHFRAFIEKP